MYFQSAAAQTPMGFTNGGIPPELLALLAQMQNGNGQPGTLPQGIPQGGMSSPALAAARSAAAQGMAAAAPGASGPATGAPPSPSAVPPAAGGPQMPPGPQAAMGMGPQPQPSGPINAPGSGAAAGAGMAGGGLLQMLMQMDPSKLKQVLSGLMGGGGMAAI